MRTLLLYLSITLITIHSLHVWLVILVINIIVHQDIAIVFLQINKYQSGFRSDALDHQNLFIRIYIVLRAITIMSFSSNCSAHMRTMAICFSLIISEKRHIQLDLAMISRSTCSFPNGVIRIVEIGAFRIDSGISHTYDNISTVQVVSFVEFQVLIGYIFSISNCLASIIIELT